MPKVKTLKIIVQETAFETEIHVNSGGIFRAALPGTHNDWPNGVNVLERNTLEELEKAWILSVKEWVSRIKLTRKVLGVRFDSTLREGGKRDFFVDRGTSLLLECGVFLETTVQGKKEAKISYENHPDHSQFHGPGQPFPFEMILDPQAVVPGRASVTILEWSQEAEDALVRACQGIVSVAKLIDRLVTVPGALLEPLSLFPALPTTTKNDALENQT